MDEDGAPVSCLVSVDEDGPPFSCLISVDEDGAPVCALVFSALTCTSATWRLSPVGDRDEDESEM